MFTSRAYGACVGDVDAAERIRPAVGTSKPAIIRSTVVLPEPDGPSIEKNSPSARSRSMPSTAVTSPNVFRSPRRLTAVASAVTVPTCSSRVFIRPPTSRV